MRAGTVEEREEYEPYVERGLVIYAGVEYAKILAAAEAESDVILSDGGNNDGAVIRAGLRITVLDALRAGHELGYYPGETNFRAADVLALDKVRAATAEAVRTLEQNARTHNPDAKLVHADLEVSVDDAAAITGRRVLVVEDGATLTDGGMGYGAGQVAAERHGAAKIIDPKPHAVGTIAEVYEAYPHLGPALPALGYSEAQRDELAQTIRRAAPDVMVDGSPAGLERVLDLDVPVVRVRYRFVQLDGPSVLSLVDALVAADRGAAGAE